MTITKILTAALLPCALMVAPAFAQSSATKADDYAKEKAVEEVKDAAKDMVTEKAAKKANDMVKSDNAMMIKGAPVMMEAPAPVIIAQDADMGLQGDTTTYKSDDIIAKPAMIDAPATATSVVIACPEGTTAQNDGTCMITGDYQE